MPYVSGTKGQFYSNNSVYSGQLFNSYRQYRNERARLAGFRSENERQQESNRVNKLTGERLLNKEYIREKQELLAVEKRKVLRTGGVEFLPRTYRDYGFTTQEQFNDARNHSQWERWEERLAGLMELGRIDNRVQSEYGRMWRELNNDMETYIKGDGTVGLRFSRARGGALARWLELLGYRSRGASWDVGETI